MRTRGINFDAAFHVVVSVLVGGTVLLGFFTSDPNSPNVLIEIFSEPVIEFLHRCAERRHR